MPPYVGMAKKQDGGYIQGISVQRLIFNPRRMREGYGTCSVVHSFIHSFVHSFIRSVHRAAETIAHF